ncbi:MAG: ABC-ATPase domain-containing protein [Armatimonadota bacterium]|nr:MAG: ABC-ATPase domain-containing protein [Armatimonadota bacterium]
MTPQNRLRDDLRRLDGKGYGAYKDLRGGYEFPRYALFIDHVQGDPFAAPSLLRLRLPQRVAQFPTDLFSTRPRRIGIEDYLTRAFGAACHARGRPNRGSGKSGRILTAACSQEVLERTSARVTPDHVEIRFFLGLPAFGRRIAGRQAEEMFFQDLPAIVESSLLYPSLPAPEVRRHVETVEDAVALRGGLADRKLVAFITDSALLPRESGVSDRPLQSDVVPFESPRSLRVDLEGPNCGQLPGMGIPEGVTLIVGGGYHGKSTLLSAIAHGVYDHIPDDGREYVVARADTVKIRAEDGRFIEKVDISPFISNLPFGRDTRAFSTPNASGSTSQAANIIEALEAGAEVLLLDEDTSATNFMIRDQRMQSLVAKDKEPITPLIDTIRALYDERGISSILVMGGSGDYFDVADTVIMLDHYRPRDVTEQAKQIARDHPTSRRVEFEGHFTDLRTRIPLARGVQAQRGRRGRVKIRARGEDGISFGDEQIDLSAVEQIVEQSQVRACGWMIHRAAERLFDGKRTLPEILDLIEQELDDKGLEAMLPNLAPDFARPRRHELAAALNRLRTLEVKQPL